MCRKWWLAVIPRLLFGYRTRLDRCADLSWLEREWSCLSCDRIVISYAIDWSTNRCADRVPTMVSVLCHRCSLLLMKQPTAISSGWDMYAAWRLAIIQRLLSEYRTRLDRCKCIRDWQSHADLSWLQLEWRCLSCDRIIIIIISYTSTTIDCLR